MKALRSKGDTRIALRTEGPCSRAFPALHSEPKPSIPLGTAPHADPLISHAASKKHDSPGPTGVQENLLPVGDVARHLGACTATVYALCARGEFPHVRIIAKAKVAGPRGLGRNFDQILSKLEGTCGPPRGLRWTSRFGQLFETTENMRGDARLPVGWNRPHNPKVTGSNPVPATISIGPIGT